MEKAVECLINRPLKTDWFALLHTVACRALPPLSVLSHLLFRSIFFFSFLSYIWWFRRHQSRSEIPSTLSVWLPGAASARICTDLLAQKTPLCPVTLYYFNLPRSFSCSTALRYLLTFKRPSIHSSFLYIHIYASVKCIRVEPRVTQSSLQLLVPGGPGLCFHIHVRAAGYLKASFSPLNTHSQACSRAKNTLHHKSRLEHAKVIHRQALLTHTPHMSGVICASDLQACTLCKVSQKYTHTHRRAHKNAHAQTHTVNTTNALSSTNNNIPLNPFWLM